MHQKKKKERELIEAIHAQISGSSGEDNVNKNPITKSAANSEKDIQNTTIYIPVKRSSNRKGCYHVEIH